VADAVRHHHEHFDGGGYPDRLSGDAIPIYARVLSLADGYDALRTVRTYHRERTHAEVIDILRGEQGGKYDPWLFGKFVHMPAPESVN
jgi:response regulator RpfG family c-di-GMP phosphodiesterase